MNARRLKPGGSSTTASVTRSVLWDISASFSIERLRQSDAAPMTS
jgi:hypothetical protein